MGLRRSWRDALDQTGCHARVRTISGARAGAPGVPLGLRMRAMLRGTLPVTAGHGCQDLRDRSPRSHRVHRRRLSFVLLLAKHIRHLPLHCLRRRVQRSSRQRWPELCKKWGRIERQVVPIRKNSVSSWAARCPGRAHRGGRLVDRMVRTLSLCAGAACLGACSAWRSHLDGSAVRASA